MPTEGEGVIAVTSVGPTGRKAYYSDYGVEQSTVAAPGGDRREYYGTSKYGAPETRILAPFPSRALGESQDEDLDREPDIDPATGEPRSPDASSASAPTTGSGSRAPRWRPRTPSASRR